MARLVDTVSGVYLWSDTLTGGSDLFAIREGVSNAIVASLRIKLFGAPAIARSAWDLKAYDLYLRGRFQWNKRTTDGLTRSIQLFTEAIGVDPSFAPGHAGLADAYTLCADYGFSAPSEVMPKAKESALRALEIDPLLAEAHARWLIVRCTVAMELAAGIIAAPD
jgi:serine/threonine-protein kinase